MNTEKNPYLSNIEDNMFERQDSKKNEKICITKEFKFDAAHRLHNLDYESPCTSQHGHSYRVKITLLTRYINRSGMIIDFSKLNHFQIWLDDNFDHATIIAKDDLDYIKFIKQLDNKFFIMDYTNTTAENMAHFFNKKFIKMFEQELEIMQSLVEVFETTKNSATSIIVK